MTREKASGIVVYLMEELTDARLRCDQLKGLINRAARLVSTSPHKAYIYEVAGDLVQGVPKLLFLLDRALDASALAASRLDYEELRKSMRPEKIQELENALNKARVRYFDLRREGTNMEKLATGSDVASALEHIASKIRQEEAAGKSSSRTQISSALQTVIASMGGETRSRFEEGKPADPTENMSPEEARKWREMHQKHKDTFKSASDWKVD